MPLKERVILWIAVIFWVVFILGVVVCGPLYRMIKNNHAAPKPSSGNYVTVTPSSDRHIADDFFQTYFSGKGKVDGGI